MVQAEREILFLPAREALVGSAPESAHYPLVVQTTEFGKMKGDLAACKGGAAEDQPCKPNLLEPYEKDSPPPDKIEYDPSKPIEALCFPEK